MELLMVPSAHVENLKWLAVVRVMPNQPCGFAARDLACLRPLNLSLLQRPVQSQTGPPGVWIAPTPIGNSGSHLGTPDWICGGCLLPRRAFRRHPLRYRQTFADAGLTGMTMPVAASLVRREA
jgi:hypothetical protein